jgi:ferredoxin-NADP reductase
VECQDIKEYFAGQFVNLQRDDGLIRSYSIANVPQQDGILEFHIRRLPDGRFSEWMHDQIRIGNRYYVKGNYDRFLFDKSRIYLHPL